MPPTRFEPSTIRNKIKREEIARKQKQRKRKEKLERRQAQSKLEADDPALKKKRQAQNVPRTLDNTREYDPSVLTANPAASSSSVQVEASTSWAPAEQQQQQDLEQPVDESAQDIVNDPFAAYFSGEVDPSVPPKVLITTSPKATKVTYNFCEELVDIFPGAEFVRRKKGKGFEMGRIAGWAAGRGYSHMMVVNEDVKQPNAITMIYLPNGPTAYFKLTSIELSKKISGHARSTAHFPELVLNGFVTRLGHTVGRMFQTLFPPMPEFQGRQVVTLHNQRDFLFFRRHRYAFRSTERVALQEIGPRFTLKMRSLKKGLPAVKTFGEPTKPLEFDTFEEGEEDQPEHAARTKTGDKEGAEDAEMGEGIHKEVQPATKDEYLWVWKPELETTRRTFFL